MPEFGKLTIDSDYFYLMSVRKVPLIEPGTGLTCTHSNGYSKIGVRKILFRRLC